MHNTTQNHVFTQLLVVTAEQRNKETQAQHYCVSNIHTTHTHFVPSSMSMTCLYILVMKITVINTSVTLGTV